jgi:hypothetical protein
VIREANHRPAWPLRPSLNGAPPLDSWPEWQEATE